MAERRLEAIGLAVVALLGGFVWLTRHPDAEIVDHATRWPWVGGAARAFRDRWRPPPPAPSAPVERTVTPFERQGRERPPATPPPASEAPRERPAPRAPEVRRFASRDATEPVGPVPGRAADPFRLERARRLLGDRARAAPLGAYTLLTDVDDAALVERWRALAVGAESAWRERYGVAPVGVAAETVVLFAHPESFVTFVADEPALAGSDAHGVAGWGLIALAAADRAATELDGVFAHELAHLLTRRSIGPALPPWLAEGLAEDFGQAPWPNGAPRFDQIRGEVRRDGLHFELRGGIAVLDLAGRRAAGSPTSDLGALAAFDDASFGEGEAGIHRYGDAFVWIRFLLAQPDRAVAFRAFLADVRDGGPADVASLERRLGVESEALGPAMVEWLLRWRAAELGRHGAPDALPDDRGRISAGAVGAHAGG